MKRRHIFLTGFMGSGKSTVGPLVAQALGYGFIDLDDVIEQREGRSIEDIFTASGEPHFRAVEKKYLYELIEQNDTVFALGGGTVTSPGIIPAVKSSGVLVYLQTEVDDLVPRLSGHAHRPLLQGDDGSYAGDAEVHRRIGTLMMQRESYYRQADIIVSTTGTDVERVVENILNALSDIIKNENPH